MWWTTVVTAGASGGWPQERSRDQPSERRSTFRGFAAAALVVIGTFSTMPTDAAAPPSMSLSGFSVTVSGNQADIALGTHWVTVTWPAGTSAKVIQKVIKEGALSLMGFAYEHDVPDLQIQAAGHDYEIKHLQGQVAALDAQVDRLQRAVNALVYSAQLNIQTEMGRTIQGR